MGFLTQQTFIPWLLGNLPGDYLEESTIEIEEQPRGNYKKIEYAYGTDAKEYYRWEHDLEIDSLSRMIIALFGGINKLKEHDAAIEEMRDALADAMDHIHEMEDIIGNSGNATLLANANRANGNYEDLLRAKALAESDKEKALRDLELLKIDYENLLDRFKELSNENADLQKKIHNLNAEKYNTVGHMAESKGEEKPSNPNQFGSKDGWTKKQKQKALLVGVTCLGWSVEDFQARFPQPDDKVLSVGTIKTYYSDVKKHCSIKWSTTFSKHCFSWENGWDDLTAPIENVFTTDELQLIDDCMNGVDAPVIPSQIGGQT